jgi:hypothetical protein
LVPRSDLRNASSFSDIHHYCLNLQPPHSVRWSQHPITYRSFAQQHAKRLGR